MYSIKSHVKTLKIYRCKIQISSIKHNVIFQIKCDMHSEIYFLRGLSDFKYTEELGICTKQISEEMKNFQKCQLIRGITKMFLENLIILYKHSLKVYSPKTFSRHI